MTVVLRAVDARIWAMCRMEWSSGLAGEDCRLELGGDNRVVLVVVLVRRDGVLVHTRTRSERRALATAHARGELRGLGG